MVEESVVLSKQATDLVSESDVGMLKEIESKFDTLMLGHSEYQIRNFMIDQFLTPDRKHRQCLHELWSRYGALVSAWYQSEKLKLEVKRCESKKKELEEKHVGAEEVATGAGDIDKEEVNLDLTHARIKQALSVHSLRESIREMRILYVVLNELEPKRKHKHYENAEEEYWEMRKKQRKS